MHVLASYISVEHVIQYIRVLNYSFVFVEILAYATIFFIDSQ